MEVKKPKPLLVGLIGLGVLVCLLIIIFIFLISPVSIGNNKEIEVSIDSGTRTSEVAKILKDKGLIKSKALFVFYAKSGNNSIKAGHYKLTKGMSLKKIVKSLKDGSNYNPNLVVLTFKEGKRITDYAKLIADNTNHEYDEVINVFKDQEYMNTLINEYWFLTDKILDPNIYYPLEGYLFPDTYHFNNKDVEVKEIIETMLKEMDENLEKYKTTISTDPHYYMTMASIVELEGTNTEDRKMIVGVFNNRLNSRMNLGSDVTTYYGIQAAMNKDLTTEQFASENLYNTRLPAMVGKMPIGPICSVSESSIEASVNPTTNDYLYFVADKNEKIYYAKTLDEHNKNISTIKAKGDWIW